MKNIEIELTTKFIGKILHITFRGIEIDENEMDNEEVLSKVFLPGQGLPMANNKLQPTPKLIVRILANICPKTESFDYFL